MKRIVKKQIGIVCDSPRQFERYVEEKMGGYNHTIQLNARIRGVYETIDARYFRVIEWSDAWPLELHEYQVITVTPKFDTEAMKTRLRAPALV